jgi:hypothetical protein
MADSDGFPPAGTPYGTMHHLVRDEPGRQREWAVAEWMEPDQWSTQEGRSATWTPGKICDFHPRPHPGRFRRPVGRMDRQSVQAARRSRGRTMRRPSPRPPYDRRSPSAACPVPAERPAGPALAKFRARRGPRPAPWGVAAGRAASGSLPPRAASAVGSHAEFRSWPTSAPGNMPRTQRSTRACRPGWRCAPVRRSGLPARAVGRRRPGILPCQAKLLGACLQAGPAHSRRLERAAAGQPTRDPGLLRRPQTSSLRLPEPRLRALILAAMFGTKYRPGL